MYGPDSCQVTELHLKTKPPVKPLGKLNSLEHLEIYIEDIRKYARKRDVDWLKAKLIIKGIHLSVSVYDAGTRMGVDITLNTRRTYSFNVDGVCSAIADVIKMRHGSDPLYLDAYQEILGLA